MPTWFLGYIACDDILRWWLWIRPEKPNLISDYMLAKLESFDIKHPPVLFNIIFSGGKKSSRRKNAVKDLTVSLCGLWAGVEMQY